MVHFLDVVIAGRSFLELYSPGFQLLNHGKTLLGIGEDRFLVDDSIIRHGNFSDILSRGSMSGNNRIIYAVHSNSDGSAPLEIGLFNQGNLAVRKGFFGFVYATLTRVPTALHYKVYFYFRAACQITRFNA